METEGMQNISLKDIRAKNLDKPCAVEVVLSTKSEVFPCHSLTDFLCPGCGASIITDQIKDGRIREPKNCPCGRKTKFILNKSKVTDGMDIKVRDHNIRRGKTTTLKVIGSELIDDLEEIDVGSIIRIFGIPLLDRTKYTFKVEGIEVIKKAQAFQVEFIRSEKELGEYLFRYPHILEEGLTPISVDSSYGMEGQRRYDLLFSDRMGNVLIIELKIYGTSDAVNQLTDYVRRYIKHNPNIQPEQIRKGIAFLGADDNLKKSAQAMGIEVFDLGHIFKKTAGDDVFAKMQLTSKMADPYSIEGDSLFQFKKSKGLLTAAEQEFFENVNNPFDIDKITSGITAEQRNRISIMKKIIDALEERVGKNIPISDIITEAESEGIEETKTREILSGLRRKGDIFEPKEDIIQKIG